MIIKVSDKFGKKLKRNHEKFKEHAKKNGLKKKVNFMDYTNTLAQMDDFLGGSIPLEKIVLKPMRPGRKSKNVIFDLDIM